MLPLSGSRDARHDDPVKCIRICGLHLGSIPIHSRGQYYCHFAALFGMSRIKAWSFFSCARFTSSMTAGRVCSEWFNRRWFDPYTTM